MSFLQSIRKSDPLPATLFHVSDVATKGWEELRAGITTVSSHGSGNLVPTVSIEQAVKKYRSWIYPCVRLISRKVAEIPYYLYESQHKGNKEAYKKIYDHEMIKLLKSPNKYLSGRELKEIIVMYVLLCGFCVVRIDRKGSGQPGRLFPMLPHELVDIELGTDTDNIIKAFLFAPMQDRQKLIRISWDDCLYFHIPHPENPYMPYTPIQAMAHATDLDLYLQVYEKDFFHNSARPDFVIIPDRHIAPESVARIQEGWSARYRGPGKHFKPAVLSESMKIQQISMSARDFEFPALASWSKEQILTTYSVSEAMLGLMGGLNKAAAVVAETIFVNNAVNPILDLYEDVIERQLLPQYRNPDGLEFEHANAKPKDDEWELAENTGKLNSGMMTLDEYREREGLPVYGSPLTKVPWMNGAPIPGVSAEADKLWKDSQAPPPNLMLPGMGGDVPPELPVSNDPAAQGAMGIEGGRPKLPGPQLSTMVGEALQSSRPALSALLTASRGNRGGLRSLIANHSDMYSIGNMLDRDRMDTSLVQLLKKGIYDYIEDKLLIDSVDKTIFRNYEKAVEELEPLESSLILQARDFYTEKGIEIGEIVKKSFASIVVKGESYVDDMTEAELRSSYRESMFDFATKAVNIGYRLGYELVKKSNKDIGWSDESERAADRAISDFLDRSADLKVKATKKALKDIIKDGLNLGLDSVEVAELIQKRFSTIGIARASMIARTELSAAVAAGQDAAFRQTNKDAGKVVIKESRLWVALDERVCSQCMKFHNHIVKDYVTMKEYLEVPIHPQCRCALRPELI